MRCQRGRVEQLKSTDYGDGINNDDIIDITWNGWICGFPKSFNIQTIDGFGNNLDYDGASIKLSCLCGGIIGKDTGNIFSPDFNTNDIECEVLMS